MKNFTFWLFLSLISYSFSAQNEEDLLRYSTSDLQGTARYAGMGGAFGALGADISVLSVNPAGMGRYKSDILTGTLNLGGGNTSVSLNGNENSTNSEAFVLNNLGIIGVVKTKIDNPSPWRKVQIGFAYNRLAEFNDNYTITGNNNASYSFVLADRGFGLNPDQIFANDYHYSSLAYENFLIDYVDDSIGQRYTTQMYDHDGEGVSHEHNVETSGRLGESAFSIAGNYADKLYIGATIGVNRIRFNRSRTQFEASNSDSLAIDNFTFVENLATSGRGINAKLGIIVLPQSWLRLGLAVHTPTNYYYMRDDWNNEIETNFKDGDSFAEESITSSFIYKMRTPGRIIGSAALVAKKIGVLSFDCEYIDYGNAILRRHQSASDSYDFSFENSISDLIYQSSLNIRAGAEYKITNQFMGRLGYAINGQALKSEYREEATPRTHYSGGIGFRNQQFFVDLAIIHTQQKENYYLYDPLLIENTALTKRWTSALLTIGYRI